MIAKRNKSKANRMEFTDKNVMSLRPNKHKQFQIWDEGTDGARGLSILVNPTGTKSYRVTYRLDGRLRGMSLGRVDEISLDEAREKANAARKKAKGGVDPDPKANQPVPSDIFLVAVEHYITHEQIGRRENKSAAQTKMIMIRKQNTGNLHSLEIGKIQRAQIEELLWAIRDGQRDKTSGIIKRRPSPYLANRLYAHLSDFFSWYTRRGIVRSSPMAGIDLPWTKGKPRDRDWFKKRAGDEAVKSLWKAATELGGDEGRYIKIMLLTGKRRAALAEMRWEQIEPDWFWDAPPSQVKTKRLHGVPLSGLAQRILSPRKADGFVFGAMSAPSFHFNRLIEKIRKLSGIDDFILHGIRHLLETKMAELRDERGHALVLPHIRDLLFDHASSRGSGRGYDHHDYVPEMRSAMELWADHVERLVQPEGAALLR